MRSVSRIGRVAALGAVIAAIALVAIVLFGGGAGGGYTISAKFINAGQLVNGNPVQTGGTAIGSVTGALSAPSIATTRSATASGLLNSSNAKTLR